MPLALVSIVIFLAMLFAGIAVVCAIRGRADGSEQEEPSMRRLESLSEQNSTASVAGRLNQDFERMVIESGLPWTPLVASLLSVSAGILCGGLALLSTANVLWAILGAVVGILLPVLFCAWRRRQRWRQIDDQLPDAIDLMARATHAGGALEQAIGMVATETQGPLGQEFRWCARQLELGLPLASAMRALANRVRLANMRTLATALAVHRQAGGNLAVTLERMAEVARGRLAFQRQVQATTGAGRLSAQLMIGAAPVLFVVLLYVQPAHIQRLLVDSPGRMLLTFAIILEIVGVVWLAKLTRLKN